MPKLHYYKFFLFFFKQCQRAPEENQSSSSLKLKSFKCERRSVPTLELREEERFEHEQRVWQTQEKKSEKQRRTRRQEEEETRHKQNWKDQQRAAQEKRQQRWEQDPREQRQHMRKDVLECHSTIYLKVKSMQKTLNYVFSTSKLM